MKPTQIQMLGWLCDALKKLKRLRKVGWYAVRDPQLVWVQTKEAQSIPPDHEQGRSLSHWKALAFELSLVLQGNFWWGSGITWCNGPYTIYLNDSRKEGELWEARAIAERLTSLDNLPFSVAGLGRKMIEWVGITDKSSSGEMLRRHTIWNYQNCTPRRLPWARYYDMKSCYGTLLRRLPSPLYDARADGRIAFRGLPPAQRQRWRAMTEAVLSHKGLRNSIIGSMAGPSPDSEGIFFYNGGQKRPGPKMEAPLRGCALLIARTAYELCAEAVEETRKEGHDTPHANVDGIITTDGFAPRIWQRLGMKVELRAEGESDIKAVGVYRVGKCKPDCKPKCEHASLPYKQGERAYGVTKWCEFGHTKDTQTQALQVTVTGPSWGQWLEGY